MAVSEHRVQEITNGLVNIKLQLALITEEELLEIMQELESEVALGPLTDPTRWQRQDLFRTFSEVKIVLTMVLELKRELERRVIKR